jgi:hypothetical protein
MWYIVVNKIGYLAVMCGKMLPHLGCVSDKMVQSSESWLAYKVNKMRHRPHRGV